MVRITIIELYTTPPTLPSPSNLFLIFLNCRWILFFSIECFCTYETLIMLHFTLIHSKIYYADESRGNTPRNNHVDKLIEAQKKSCANNKS